MSKINISIDDVSPHPYSSTKVLDRCFELIKLFPQIKFSLFVPTAYWRTRSNKTEKPLFLSQYQDFCAKIKSLNKNNFQLGFHGHFHGIPNKSDNDEFQYLNYQQACEVFQESLKEMDKAGLSDCYSPIFRPPAWRMTGDSIKALRDNGIEAFALSQDSYAVDTYQGMNEQVDCVYQTACPPDKPLELFKKTEIVYHACEWLDNYLDTQKTEQLASFLKANLNEAEFCFIEEMK